MVALRYIGKQNYNVGPLSSIFVCTCTESSDLSCATEMAKVNPRVVCVSKEKSVFTILSSEFNELIIGINCWGFKSHIFTRQK